MSDQEGKRRKRQFGQAKETENQIDDELKRINAKEAFESRRTKDTA
jgi:hypothetical protein